LPVVGELDLTSFLTKDIVKKTEDFAFGIRHQTITKWAESFLYAASTAVILLIISLFPDCRYLAFIALVPLLYRIFHADINEATRLGIILGLCYLSVLLSDSILIFKTISVLIFLIGVGLFVPFSRSAVRTKNRLGFNPIIIALLWAGFELILLELGLTDGFFNKIYQSSSIFAAITIVCGLLGVSLIVVIINTVLLITLEKTLSLVKTRVLAKRKCVRSWILFKCVRSWILFTEPGIFTNKNYLMTSKRDPPCRNVIYL